MMKTVTERWEEGIEHDSRSVALYKSIAKIDREQGDDSMQFKSSGDGTTGRV